MGGFARKRGVVANRLFACEWQGVKCTSETMSEQFVRKRESSQVGCSSPNGRECKVHLRNDYRGGLGG